MRPPGADIGKVGEAKDVQKVIRVQMYDNYFKPTAYKIKEVKQLILSSKIKFSLFMNLILEQIPNI